MGKLARITWENKDGSHHVEAGDFTIESEAGVCFITIDGKKVPIGVISSRQPSGVYLQPGALAHYLKKKTGSGKYVRIYVHEERPALNRTLTVKIKDAFRLKENGGK